MLLYLNITQCISWFQDRDDLLYVLQLGEPVILDDMDWYIVAILIGTIDGSCNATRMYMNTTNIWIWLCDDTNSRKEKLCDTFQLGQKEEITSHKKRIQILLFFLE